MAQHMSNMESAGEAVDSLAVRHAMSNAKLAELRDRLYDRALSAEEVAAAAGVENNTNITDEELLARMTPADRNRRAELQAGLLGLLADGPTPSRSGGVMTPAASTG